MLLLSISRLARCSRQQEVTSQICFDTTSCSSKTGVRLRIECNRPSIVLNILLKSVLLKKVMHCLVAVAFLWTPCRRLKNLDTHYDAGNMLLFSKYKKN